MDSMLFCDPMKRIWVVGLMILSSSAMATAGYMWPPVPPAAKTIRRVLSFLMLVSVLESLD